MAEGARWRGSHLNLQQLAQHHPHHVLPAHPPEPPRAVDPQRPVAALRATPRALAQRRAVGRAELLRRRARQRPLGVVRALAGWAMRPLRGRGLGVLRVLLVRLQQRRLEAGLARREARSASWR